MRFRFIEEHRSAFSIGRMCRVMDVSPRGLRAFRSRPASHRQRSDMITLAHIKEQSRLSLGDTAQGRDGDLRIHKRVLQSATTPLSSGLGKPCRLRTKSSLNEHRGRHKSVTGPALRPSNTQHSNGSIGSTTAVCWNPSGIPRQQKPRQTSMRHWKDQTWPRN